MDKCISGNSFRKWTMRLGKNVLGAAEGRTDIVFTDKINRMIVR